MTPFEFILQQRMAAAISFLQAGDMSITAIAAEIGYLDAGSFSKAFRAYYGVAPRQVRNGARVEAPA